MPSASLLWLATQARTKTKPTLLGVGYVNQYAMLFVSCIGLRQIIAMLREVRHRLKRRTTQRARFLGIAYRRTNLVDPLCVGRDVRDPNRSWGLSMNSFAVDLILMNGAIGQHFFHYRHEQTLAERVDRIVRSIGFQLINRDVGVDIFPRSGMPVV